MAEDYYRELIEVKYKGNNYYVIHERDERGDKLSGVNSKSGLMWEQKYGEIRIDLDK